MHSEYEQYAHHFGLPELPKPDTMDIKRVFPGGVANESSHQTSDGRIWVFSCAVPRPNNSQPIITEDIDYEIVEPPKLPPSNTTNE
jgi:hypothetical protein